MIKSTKPTLPGLLRNENRTSINAIWQQPSSNHALWPFTVTPIPWSAASCEDRKKTFDCDVCNLITMLAGLVHGLFFLSTVSLPFTGFWFPAAVSLSITRATQIIWFIGAVHTVLGYIESITGA